MSGNPALVAMTLLSCILVMAGCGRKGALEPPPSVMIEDDRGKQQQKPQEDRPFILDRLIR